MSSLDELTKGPLQLVVTKLLTYHPDVDNEKAKDKNMRMLISILRKGVTLEKLTEKERFMLYYGCKNSFQATHLAIFLKEHQLPILALDIPYHLTFNFSPEQELSTEKEKNSSLLSLFNGEHFKVRRLPSIAKECLNEALYSTEGKT